MPRGMICCALLMALLIAPIAVACEAAKEEKPNEYERLLERQARAIVTIKYVLKTEYDGGVDEEEMESTGVIIDPSGLVLCSNMLLAGSRLFETLGMRSLATRTRVLLDDASEELDAKIVAQDKELDLVWLRIKNADGKKFPSVDFDRAARARPGERLLTIVRLDKFFDRAAVVHEGRLAGVLHKPRELLAPGSGLEGEAGLPVFNVRGEIVGIFVTQMPDAEDHDSDPDGLIDTMEVFILPAEAAIKATKRALASDKGG